MDYSLGLYQVRPPEDKLLIIVIGNEEMTPLCRLSDCYLHILSTPRQLGLQSARTSYSLPSPRYDLSI